MTDVIASGFRIGRYEILSLLSAGGMGELYHARDPELGRELVLKLLPRRGVFHPDALERFIREARAASALNHPNIVTVYEIGESEMGHFIAMEFIDGRTFRQLRIDSPSIATVAKIGAQTARALSVAHAAGIIHRDIKPENLMLRADGYVKILDFGIAQLGAPEPGTTNDSRITQPGFVVGTMRYMSPEQAGGHVVSAATDIFSLGLVLYELAAGRHPFESSSDMAVLSAIILREAQPASKINNRVPAVFDSLVMRMLAKAPAERPTAVEVHEILDKLCDAQLARRQATTSVAVKGGVIGRESELDALSRAFEAAHGGRASMICVSGEPGIGKTTLIEAFLGGLSGTQPHSVALGRCSERLAGAEAYLPLLDAIDDLLHEDRSSDLSAAFHRIAPTWCQMLAGTSPATTEPNESSPAQSQERMKRELAAFLDEVSARQPLVLLIEDIHWADVSTIDVLGYVLTRLRSSRILAVATYRPAELLLGSHPFLALKLDLQTRGAAREIPLAFLTEEYVGRFIADRFPGNRFPHEFTTLIHSRTEGSPLFVEDLLRYLKSRGAIRQDSDMKWEIQGALPDLENDIPESMRSMVERKVSQLDADDRNLLAAASVQGHSFDSAIVAKAIDSRVGDVEDRLENLDRVHGFVHRAGERDFPNGDISGRYRFVHVLYQNSLYASLSVSRRVALSKSVGATLLELHSGNPASVAAELGFLFETARELEGAAGYFALAAQSAAGVFAVDEASRLAHRGIALLRRQGPSPQRAGLELGLQLVLGSSAAVMGGYAAAEAMAAMERARSLAEELGDTPQLSPALWGLFAYYLVRGDIPKALDICKQSMHIAMQHKGEMALMTAHASMGITLRFTGKYEEAVEHFEKAEALYDPSRQGEYLALYHMDPGVFSLAEMTRTLWGAGFVDRAIEIADNALALAKRSPDPRTLAFALLLRAVMHVMLRDPAAVLDDSDQGIAIADEHQIVQERAWLTTSRGWALASLGKVDEGIEELSASLAMRQRMNANLDLPFALSQLADAYRLRGDIDRARQTLQQAIETANRNHDVWSQSDIYRMLGDLARVDEGRLGDGKSEDISADTEVRAAAAEAYYLRALEIARKQGARSFELRAAVRLAKLMMDSGRVPEARALVAPIRSFFDGQRATADTAEADEVLAFHSRMETQPAS